MFQGRTAERIALYICLPLLVLVCFVTWRLSQHLERLDSDLAASQQRESSLQAQVRDETGRAALANAAAKQAALEREMARSEAAQSRVEATLAIEEADRQRLMAEAIRAQRASELDSMRDALGRIAETERTPMGVVVSLGEDSFLFDFDKADLRPRNREILSRISGVLLASYGYKLYVYGHTDDQGDPTYNQQLSERRASAVKAYMVEAGLPLEIIESKGFGQSSPRVKGTSQDARKHNRRVEIGVVDIVVEYKGLAGSNE